MKNLYRIILESSSDVYRILVPAKTEEEAKNYVAGNGDIVDIKDVTDAHEIDVNAILRHLVGKVNQDEYQIIMRLLLDYRGAK